MHGKIRAAKIAVTSSENSVVLKVPCKPYHLLLHSLITICVSYITVFLQNSALLEI